MVSRPDTRVKTAAPMAQGGPASGILVPERAHMTELPHTVAPWMRIARHTAAMGATLTIWTSGPAIAQAQRGAVQPESPQAAAPIDLTGYWVSVVTEDWRWRMLTPRKGDYASVPINNEARRVADSWDPTKDEREGSACKAYGAPAIMRVPGRAHISWDTLKTLKIELDAGTQTRVFHFGDTQPPAGVQSWQGYSMAMWEIAGGGRAGAVGAVAGPRYGSLKVVTTRLKPGYLRKNGVPYSENAVVTEYYDRHSEQNGDEWFTVTTTVEDGKYLIQPFITSSSFKKEPDGSKWRPTTCAAR